MSLKFFKGPITMAHLVQIMAWNRAGDTLLSEPLMVRFTDTYQHHSSSMSYEVTLQWRHNGHDSVSNHQPHDCLLSRFFRRRSKKTSKLRVTGLCAGNSPATGEFPAQMASNAENVSIWWRHHVYLGFMGCYIKFASYMYGNDYKNTIIFLANTFICNISPYIFNSPMEIELCNVYLFIKQTRWAMCFSHGLSKHKVLQFA